MISFLPLGGSIFILTTGVGAVSPNKDESFLPFLFAAYTLTWIGFFAYAFFLHRKQKDLSVEIQQLKAMFPTPNSSSEKGPDKV